MNLSTKQKMTHRRREQTGLARGSWGGREWEFGVSRCKLWETVEDRGVWHAAVHGIAKSWIRLSKNKMQTIYIEWINNKVPP